MTLAGDRLSRLKWRPLRIVVVLLAVAIMVALYSYSNIYAATSTELMLPNSDITTGWPGTSGSSDGSCSGGSHCDYVDDGVTNKTSDYISTSGSTSGGEAEEYGLTSPSIVQTASQVVVRFYARTAAIGGGTADTLSINLRVDGVLQSATNCTATTSWSACSATYNGSWSQASVDSMQVYIQRIVAGSGNPSGQADTIQLANVYATLTYTPTLVLSQSTYRWFNNQDVSNDAKTTFAKVYTPSGIYSPRNVIQAPDGNYVVVGSTISTSYYGMSVSKISSSSNELWSNLWGGEYNPDYAFDVAYGDSGYMVVGSTGVYGVGYLYPSISKYTSAGVLEWVNIWGSQAGYGDANSIIRTSDSNYAVTGYVNDSTGDDMFIAKYSSTGSLIWGWTWGGTGSDLGQDIAQTSDGGYVAVGQTSSYGSNTMFVVKYDSSGVLQWSKAFSGIAAEGTYSVAPSSDGGSVITGSVVGDDGLGGNQLDMFILKISSSGAPEWGKTWGLADDDDTGKSITQTTDGGYAVTGTSASFSSGIDNMYIAKYTSNGTLEWSKLFGGNDALSSRSITQAADSGYLILGTSKAYSTNDSAVVIKADDNGVVFGCSSFCSDVTGAAGVMSATTMQSVTPITSVLNDYASKLEYQNTSDFNVDTTSVVPSNFNTIDVGSPIANQDSLAAIPAKDDIVRLRVGIHVEGAEQAVDALQLKLQYAPKGGALACSAVPTIDFTDVTDSSVIRYADNSVASSGMTPLSNISDPVHGSDTNVMQEYLEAGTATFTNASIIPSGQDGLWDFALQANGAPSATSYCFRIVHSDGSLLDTMDVYPELQTATVSPVSVAIVDSSGAELTDPSFPMSLTLAQGLCQQTTGTFGTNDQRLRVTNNLVASGWNVSIAATNGPTATWSDPVEDNSYDFNDPAGSPPGCTVGSDGDMTAGLLSVDPTVATITPKSGCTNDGISASTGYGFDQNNRDSIRLIIASSSAAANCYWDMTGVSLTQQIPADQPPGQYSFDLTMTVVAQ